VVHASVEFDLETLRPTYRLTIGLPGRSNALAIAQRLGMPEQIIAAARSELSPTDVRAEDLLDEIYRQRDLTIKARQAAEEARIQVDELRAELVERLEAIEDERQKVLDASRLEAREQLKELEDEVDELRRRLSRLRQPTHVVDDVEEKLSELEENVEKPRRRRTPKPGEDVLLRPVRLGDTVRLRRLNTQGVVSAVEDDEAEVQVGALRVRTRLADLQPISEGSQPATKTRGEPTPASSLLPPADLPASPGFELDLRGQRADDALEALESFLDSAYLSGLPFVRIIHGKGTGKLRQAVRQRLQNHPHVSSHEAGSDKEGGEGVTIAKLRAS
jgi:DNA mismatch repair protein MutS2